MLADVLDCATLTDDELPDEIFASYQAGALMPPAATDDPAPAAIEIAFLLNMLAATSRVDPRKSPTQSYLPSHWSN